MHLNHIPVRWSSPPSRYLWENNTGDSDSDSRLGAIVLRVLDAMIAKNISYYANGPYNCRLNQAQFEITRDNMSTQNIYRLFLVIFWRRKKKWQLFIQILPGVSFVSQLEMIWGIWEDVPKSYKNLVFLYGTRAFWDFSTLESSG